MKVFFEIPYLEENTTIAIGTFDGVHSGHQEILKRAKEIATKNNQKLVVFTFIDHPSIVTGSKLVPHLLTTSEEKISLLSHTFEPDYCIMPSFTKGFSMLTPEEFIDEILVKKLKAKNICVGFNFFFGYKAEGNNETLLNLSHKYNYHAEIVPPFVYENETVSSSMIRELIASNNLDKANKMLGYKYKLRGNIVKGKGIGKSVLGIPTANIAVNGRKLVPSNGVYACDVKIRDKNLKGIVNIGNRPTFDNGTKSIEVHIFDFEDNIYDEQMEICLVMHLRGEKKFNGPDALKAQILSDIEEVKNFFKH